MRGGRKSKKAPRHHSSRSSGWDALGFPADDDGGQPQAQNPSRRNRQSRTLRVRGLVTLPAALQAAAVGAGAFYAFGSALLLCVIVMLAVASAALLSRRPAPERALTSDCDDGEMLECVTLAHLESRLRRRTLRLEDCLHYALFKLLRLGDAVSTARRSMLDYSLTVSIAQQQQETTAAGHDLLELVDAVEREKLQLQASAAATLMQKRQQPQSQPQQQEQQPQQQQQQQPKKKKKPVRKRRAVSVDTVFSSRVTVEEYTVLPERPSLYQQPEPVVKDDDEEEEHAKQGAWIVAAFTAEPLEPAKDDELETVVLLPEPVVAKKEPRPVEVEPPKAQEVEGATPLASAKPKKKKLPRQRATSVEVTSLSAIPEKKQLRRRATSVEMMTSSLPAIAEKKLSRRRATSVDTASKPPAAVSEKKKKARLRVESVDENSATQDAVKTAMQAAPVMADALVAHAPESVIAVSVATVPDTVSPPSSPEKTRRRRNSRRSRPRRSTLSNPERPSYYEDFLLLEPVIANTVLAKTLVDKNQELYAAEAEKVRALQEAQPPIETKAISNPEIRIMVDEVNSRVTRMHESLASNWAFLASLSDELLAAEEAEAKRHEAAMREEAARKAAALLEEDDFDDFDDADLLDTELRYSELEPEFEDECYGDVDYDDHYYAYHAMSTPCL